MFFKNFKLLTFELSGIYIGVSKKFRAPIYYYSILLTQWNCEKKVLKMRKVRQFLKKQNPKWLPIRYLAKFCRSWTSMQCKIFGKSSVFFRTTLVFVVTHNGYMLQYYEMLKCSAFSSETFSTHYLNFILLTTVVCLF